MTFFLKCVKMLFHEIGGIIMHILKHQNYSQLVNDIYLERINLLSLKEQYQKIETNLKRIEHYHQNYLKVSPESIIDNNIQKVILKMTRDILVLERIFENDENLQNNDTHLRIKSQVSETCKNALAQLVIISYVLEKSPNNRTIKRIKN